MMIHTKTRKRSLLGCARTNHPISVRFYFAFAFVVALLVGARNAATAENQIAAQQQVAVLSGGCFWGVDAVFKHVKGVAQVLAGYSGGDAPTAAYETVSSGETGHAESVEVTFNPSEVSYQQLLEVFFSVAHDPTELNRQGPDTGTQYRSVIFYANDQQKAIAEGYIAELTRKKIYSDPIVTQVVPLKKFYPAEAYHQNYLELHPDSPYIVYNDLPKLTALKKQFPNMYRP